MKRKLAIAVLLAAGTIAIAQHPDSVLIATHVVTRTVWRPPFVEPVRVDTLAVWTDTTVYQHGGGK